MRKGTSVSSLAPAKGGVKLSGNHWGIFALSLQRLG